MEQQINAFAESPEYSGRAKLLLSKLFNHQAEQYRLMAVRNGKEADSRS